MGRRYEDEDEDEENSDDENEMNSEQSWSETLDELKEIMEAGDEEKEEDSGSSSATGEGEGESEEEGKSAGNPGEDETEEDSKIITQMEGPGAGVGSPSDDEYIPHSTTDENFRSRESELVTTDEKASMFYVNLPVANLDNIIIDHKEIHKDISEHYSMSGEEYRRGNSSHDRN
ncbi:hypothetical protein HX858_08490 [Marine Group I thaumarchaeote]|uniref:Uncharacterized protein n=1 Tax=Marine Group I thaumarchaeote TaxID=2511932 RepID=A0A7K4MWT9_9ARCH|nr:hypothetical protein [Marine Group I thaumarchaeote]